MKKGLFVLLVLILLMTTGCGNDGESSAINDEKTDSKEALICERSLTDEAGYETTEKVTIYHKDNLIESIKSELQMEVQQEMVDVIMNSLKEPSATYEDIEGVSYSVENEGNIINITSLFDYNTLDPNDLFETTEDDYEYIKDGKPLYDLYKEQYIDIYDEYECNEE